MSNKQRDVLITFASVFVIYIVTGSSSCCYVTHFAQGQQWYDSPWKKFANPCPTCSAVAAVHVVCPPTLMGYMIVIWWLFNTYILLENVQNINFTIMAIVNNKKKNKSTFCSFFQPKKNFLLTQFLVSFSVRRWRSFTRLLITIVRFRVALLCRT